MVSQELINGAIDQCPNDCVGHFVLMVVMLSITSLNSVVSCLLQTVLLLRFAFIIVAGIDILKYVSYLLLHKNA